MVDESNDHCNHVKYQASLTLTGRRPLSVLPERDIQDIQHNHSTDLEKQGKLKFRVNSFAASKLGTIF